MSDPRTPRSFVERHRLGRIPTPTPLPVGDIHSHLVFPPVTLQVIFIPEDPDA